jgi:hypothetical protein
MRPPRELPRRRPGEPPPIPRRSHAAVPAAFAVVLLGAILGVYTVLVPVLLGLGLLLAGGSFLSTRLNPFSVGFYLTTKPSWTAIGVVFLSGVVLWVIAYLYVVHGLAPIVPGGAR